MKILSKYVLREHVGPFLFALTALTSLLLLNFISRQLGELVGKGLPTSAIGEFFLLSLPFTVALTLPMSVLVAVLYAFSRLAAENEVTALKASGVSPFRLVAPSIGAGVVMSLFLLFFNDQILPRANHQLKTLQDDISQTKPTFLLKEQVINPVSEGKLYLKAGKIDRGGSRLKEVVIYDLADPTRRRTIYADSGTIAFAGNKRDLELELYSGEIEQTSMEKPTQLNRLFYKSDRITVKDVAGSFSQTQSDSTSRGERELGVCAMQKRLHAAQGAYHIAQLDYEFALKESKQKVPRADARAAEAPVFSAKVPEPRGIGWAYCTLVSRVFGVKTAEAAEAGIGGQDPRRPAQDTMPRAARDSVARKAQQDSLARRGAADSAARAQAAAAPGVPGGAAGTPPATSQATPPRASGPAAAGAGGPTTRPAPVHGGDPPPVPSATVPPVPPPGMVILGATPKSAAEQGLVAVPGAPAGFDVPKTPEQLEAEASATSVANMAAMTSRIAEAKLRLDIAKKQRNRYDVEIHKKFSLAAACLIFVILGAPIALRFPRGGVGLVIGVSLLVFALYYVGLIGGEALANKGLMNPFWAMWGANVVLTAVGVVLLFRMGREANTGRGGDWGDRFERLRDAIRSRRVKPARAAA